MPFPLHTSKENTTNAEPRNSASTTVEARGGSICRLQLARSPTLVNNMSPLLDRRTGRSFNNLITDTIDSAEHRHRARIDLDGHQLKHEQRSNHRLHLVHH